MLKKHENLLTDLTMYKATIKNLRAFRFVRIYCRLLWTVYAHFSGKLADSNNFGVEEVMQRQKAVDQLYATLIANAERRKVRCT